MQKRISLLLPTRGRRSLAKRFLGSVLEMSSRPDLIEVIICVDDDDPESYGIRVPGLKVVEIVGPRQSMGRYNTACLEQATGDITIAVNDDVIIRTNGWDDKVRALDALFEDGVYLGYGNDKFKGPKLCTFPILSRRCTQVMLEPYPEAYRGAFLDMHLMDIFKRLEHAGFNRMVYCEDIVFEHRHYRVDPSALDATYTERPRFADDATFIALADLRQEDADRLVGAIEQRDPAMDSIGAIQRAAASKPNVVTIVPLCVSRFFLDRRLPLRWRSYLCVWMIARHYYGSLRPA